MSQISPASPETIVVLMPSATGRGDSPRLFADVQTEANGIRSLLPPA